MKEEIKFINYRRYILVISVLAIMSIILNLMFIISPVFATYFADNIGTRIRLVLGAFYSKLPITAHELFIFVVVLVLVFSLGRIIVFSIKYHNNQMRFKVIFRIKKSLLNYVCFLLVILLLISSNYFVNFHRIDFFSCNNMRSPEYSIEELKTEAEQYSDYTAMTIEDIAAEALSSMENLSQKYPCLGNSFFVAKKNLVIKSFVSPITTEVGYNLKDLEPVYFPYELCKLLAKQAGFVRDEEANEIAFQCCLMSENNLFRYSGYLGKIAESKDVCPLS